MYIGGPRVLVRCQAPKVLQCEDKSNSCEAAADQATACCNSEIGSGWQFRFVEEEEEEEEEEEGGEERDAHRLAQICPTTRSAYNIITTIHHSCSLRATYTISIS